MEDKKPVALWKGIVGTALSGFLLLILIPFDFFVTSLNKNELLWLSVTLLTCTAVCLFSLIISLVNLISTTNYKKNKSRQVREKESTDDNTELLHKLLSEGKITIEEYDKLKGNK